MSISKNTHAKVRRVHDETIRVRPDIKQHRIVHTCRQTEELSNVFLERLRVRLLSENTATAYAYDLVFLLRWLAESRQSVFTFTRQDLFDYVKMQTERGAKPRSINRRLVVCDLFLRFLEERSLCTHPSHSQGRLGAGASSPSKGLWPQKRGTTRLRVKVPFEIVEPLQAEEVNDLLKGVRYYRDLAVILLMTLVGLRRHEILAVQVCDVDFVSKIIRIKGKGKKERVMPLPAMVTSTLRKYIEYERPPAAASATLFLVLQNPRRGEPMTAAGLRSFFRKRRRTSRVLKAHPHRLRHTFAYSMVKAGVSIAVLQKMMGHARYTTTLQYVALRAEDVAEQYLDAMKKIENQHGFRGHEL
jgi:site-specific recombinase XerD